MRNSVLLVNSLAGSALLVLTSATGTLLHLMFSTGEGEFGRKEGLFGSVFFESEDKGDGVVGATMGLGDPIALAVLFVLIFAVLALVQLSVRRFRSGRTSETSRIGAERNHS